MRIGIGNKRFDQISFLISGVIIVALAIGTFININVLAFLGIFFLTTVVKLALKMGYRYITFDQGNFVIENVLNKRIVLKSDLFDRVYLSRFGFPFLNILRVYFKNGESYRIIAGPEMWYDMEAKIKNLISEAGKAS
jgi:hypothetical protein